MAASITTAGKPLTLGDLEKMKASILGEMRSLSNLVADRLMAHLSNAEGAAILGRTLQISAQTPSSKSSVSDRGARPGTDMMDRPTMTFQSALPAAAQRRHTAVPVTTQHYAPLLTCNDLESFLAQRLEQDPLLPMRWEQELQRRLQAQSPSPDSSPLRSSTVSSAATPLSTCPSSPLLGLHRAPFGRSCLSSASAGTTTPSYYPDAGVAAAAAGGVAATDGGWGRIYPGDGGTPCVRAPQASCGEVRGKEAGNRGSGGPAVIPQSNAVAPAAAATFITAAASFAPRHTAQALDSLPRRRRTDFHHYRSADGTSLLDAAVAATADCTISSSGDASDELCGEDDSSPSYCTSSSNWSWSDPAEVRGRTDLEVVLKPENSDAYGSDVVGAASGHRVTATAAVARTAGVVGAAGAAAATGGRMELPMLPYDSSAATAAAATATEDNKSVGPVRVHQPQGNVRQLAVAQSGGSSAAAAAAAATAAAAVGYSPYKAAQSSDSLRLAVEAAVTAAEIPRVPVTALAARSSTGGTFTVKSIYNPVYLPDRQPRQGQEAAAAAPPPLPPPQRLQRPQATSSQLSLPQRHATQSAAAAAIPTTSSSPPAAAAALITAKLADSLSYSSKREVTSIADSFRSSSTISSSSTSTSIAIRGSLLLTSPSPSTSISSTTSFNTDHRTAANLLGCQHLLGPSLRL